MPGSILNVEHKIFRAVQHLESLQVAISEYFQSNPGHLVADEQPNPNQISATFQPRIAIPTRVPIIAGDCLQNLRSSLDYLVWELVLAANGNPGKQHEFPICKTSDIFKQRISSGALDGVPPDAITEIEELQPYRLGQHWEKSILWILNEFTNINKHRRILLTLLRGGPIPVSEANFVTIDGQTWMNRALPHIDQNAKFGPFPINAKGEVQLDVQIIAYITFDEGVMKGMELSSTLNGWINLIQDEILPLFKKFFS